MPNRLVALMDERKRLERDLSEARKKLAMGGGGAQSADDSMRTVGDVKLIARAGFERRRVAVRERRHPCGPGGPAISSSNCWALSPSTRMEPVDSTEFGLSPAACAGRSTSVQSLFLIT